MRRLIHRYLEHLQGERQVSPETLRAYERDLLTFHEFLARDFLGKEPGGVRPQDVDALAVRSFLAALTRRGLSKRSQGRALSAVRSLFRFACREGTLEANPAQGVRTPKVPQTLPRHLRPGEVERLIEAPEG
ncbi:MAG TPA: site-specific integrase, partial [Thermoanaerobaculia bacterium]